MAVVTRVRSFVRRRPLLSGLGAAAIVGIGAYLFFGFFAFHLLFVDSTVDEADPFAAAATTEVVVTTVTTAVIPIPAEPAPTTTTTTVVPQVVVLAEGQFVSREHPTSGTARIISDGDQTFLRLEGFATDNGPDLNVYLATGPADGTPGDFVDLGDLKGNIGDQNYEIRPTLDLAPFTTVFIWCVRFGVAFGAAPLT